MESYTVNLETERTFLNSIKMTNSDSVIRLHIENVKRIVILLVAIGFEFKCSSRNYSSILS